MKKTKNPLSPALFLVQRPGTGLTAAFLLGLAAQCLIIQKNNPSTLFPAILLYGLAVCFFLGSEPLQNQFRTEKTFAWTAKEITALVFILLLALGLRIYKISDFPTIVDMDEASEAWGGLMISHNHWNLFDHLKEVKLLQPTITHWAALWFTFLSPTKTHLFLFGSLLSLLAFPGIYFTFRQLAGPRTALLTLFFLAVSRWHITYGRAAHPAMDFLIYMFGSLAFWIGGFRTGKKWLFIPAAILTGVGLYSYQAYFSYLPLLAVFYFYECAETNRTNLWRVKTLFPAFGAAYLLALVAGWPLVQYLPFLLQHGGFGPALVKAPVFFDFNLSWEGLQALGKHFLDMVLMFNRRGDFWVVHNLPNQRMLDDVTGILFVFGFFLAAARLSRRKYFYAIAGMAVMSFINFLSDYPAHASRMMGALPFAAFLAALSLESIESRLRNLFPKKSSTFPLIFTASLLALAAFQNAYIYFEKQAKDPECRGMARLAQTVVGSEVQKGGDSYEYYLSSRFYGHYTVMFLGFFQRDHTHLLSLPEILKTSSLPAVRGMMFALDQGQTGVLNLLQTLYPGGQTEFVKGEEKNSIVCFYRVPENLAGQDLKLAVSFSGENFGLKGVYSRSLDEMAPPVLIRRDPVINFTFRNDFPLDPAPPFSAHWSGVLEIPSSGYYRFLALSTDQTRLLLNRKIILSPGKEESSPIFLRKGPQKIEVHFQKSKGMDAALSLLWKKKEWAKYEVVPFSVLKEPR